MKSVQDLVFSVQGAPLLAIVLLYRHNNFKGRFFYRRF